MKTFEEFKEAVREESMHSELAAYLKARKPEDKAAEVTAICAFAAEKGFAVTPEELGIDAAGSRELSDDEVENAAGGKFCWDNFTCGFVNKDPIYDCESAMF